MWTVSWLVGVWRLILFLILKLRTALLDFIFSFIILRSWLDDLNSYIMCKQSKQRGLSCFCIAYRMDLSQSCEFLDLDLSSLLLQTFVSRPDVFLADCRGCCQSAVRGLESDSTPFGLLLWLDYETGGPQTCQGLDLSGLLINVYTRVPSKFRDIFLLTQTCLGLGDCFISAFFSRLMSVLTLTCLVLGPQLFSPVTTVWHELDCLFCFHSDSSREQPCCRYEQTQSFST